MYIQGGTGKVANRLWGNFIAYIMTNILNVGTFHFYPKI